MNIEISKSVKEYITEYILLTIGGTILLLHYFIVPFTNNVQMAFLLITVFIIGVPHGSLDFVVDEQNELAKNNIFSIKKFVSVYVLRLAVFSLFWIIPWFAFSLFIVFSIYHFGETDMSAIMKPTQSSNLLYTSYGIFILSILLLNNISAIAATVPAMNSYVQNNTVYNFLLLHKMSLIILAALFFLLILALQIKKNKINISYHQLAQFIALITIILCLPMMLAFTFYFALWHSIISLRNVYSYFKKSKGKASFNFIRNKSIMFSTMALIGLLATYLGLKYFLPQTNMLFALLILLSVLTLPHLTVMHSMYKNFNKNLLN